MEYLKVWLLERSNRMLSSSSADFVCTVPNERGEVRTDRPVNDWRLDGRCIRVEKDVHLGTWNIRICEDVSGYPDIS